MIKRTLPRTIYVAMNTRTGRFMFDRANTDRVICQSMTLHDLECEQVKKTGDGLSWATCEKEGWRIVAYDRRPARKGEKK